jgi:hypothetical protein
MHPSSVPSADLGRRRVQDRRRRPTSPLWPLGGPRRRQSFRRAGEGIRRYVDRLELCVSGWAILIIVLSSVDAMLTLLHLERGGEEWMPTMRWALSIDRGAFLGLKLAFTACGTVVLAAHQNFPAARFFIRVAFFAYLFLTAYHLALICLAS